MCEYPGHFQTLSVFLFPLKKIYGHYHSLLVGARGILIHLMSVQFVLLTVLVVFESTSMHGLPCSSLGHCFDDPGEGSSDPPSSQEPSFSTESKDEHNLSAPVTSQPEVLPGLCEHQRRPSERTASQISTCSSRAGRLNGTNSVSSNCHRPDTDDEVCFESSPISYSISQSSEDEEEESDFSPEMELKYPQIPRPSIIIRLPQV